MRCRYAWTMTPTPSAPTQADLSYATLTVSRKLPDDLSLLEYSELVNGVEALTYTTRVLSRKAPAPTRVIRSSYGSDFELIVQVSLSSIAILSATAKVIDQIYTIIERSANIEKLSAETRLLNLDAEQRASEISAVLKDERLRQVTEVQWEQARNEPRRSVQGYRLIEPESPEVGYPQEEIEEARDALVRTIIIFGSYDMNVEIRLGR